MTTYEGALEEMIAWASGHKSHWNLICEMADQIPRATLWAECCRADAAEVEKWAAVVRALRPGVHQ